MIEIVIVICFKEEASLLIVGPGGGRPSSRFRAEVRNSVGKSSLYTGNRPQGLVCKQENHTASISTKGCMSFLRTSADYDPSVGLV